MARAQTENFWEMIVEIETSGGNLPQTPVMIEAISKANPAVVTVGIGAISQFNNGDEVTLGGVEAAGFAGANGVHTVSAVNLDTGVFSIDFDASAAAAPAGPGGTVTPANPRPAAVPITGITNADPAVITVGTGAIGGFKAGDEIMIAGVTAAGFSGINGPQTVASVSTVAGTITTAFDAAAASAPAGAGGTAQGASPPNDQLVWAKICGLTSRTVTRADTMQTAEVPDCDDESLPSSIERSVQSQEVSVTGTGVWAAQSSPMMMAWWYSGKTKNIRITNVKTPAGGIETETGPAYLTNLNNTAAKGNKVTADITIAFDGVPQLGYAGGAAMAA